jgi:DNA-binding NarL/FixJ family response regulator
METQVRGRGLPPGLSQINCMRIRAVVADDHPDMQKIVIHSLECNGMVEVVGTADDGEMAVAVAEALSPELVVLDVHMPRMSGLEAALLIKESLPGTKVLIISANNDPALAVRAVECGADGFLWKGNLVNECSRQIEGMFCD